MLPSETHCTLHQGQQLEQPACRGCKTYLVQHELSQGQASLLPTTEHFHLQAAECIHDHVPAELMTAISALDPISEA